MAILSFALGNCMMHSGECKVDAVSTASEVLVAGQSNGYWWEALASNNYNPRADGSPEATSDRYVYIYRNGTLVHSDVACYKTSGANYPQPAACVPICFDGTKFWYGQLFFTSYVPYYRLIYYDTLTGTATTAYTSAALDQSYSGAIIGAQSICVARDASTGKLYVVVATHSDNSTSDHSHIRIDEFTSAGSLDHNVMMHSHVPATYIAQYVLTGLAVTDGTIYFGHHGQPTGTWRHEIGKIAASSSGASTWTSTSTTSGGDLDTAVWGSVGPWGLYMNYNTTVMRSQNSATTWTLTSYIDTDQHWAVIEKTSTNEDFLILCRKGTSLYLVALSNAGGVTLCETKTVSSDYDFQHPWTVNVGSHLVGIEDAKIPIICGSAKKYLHLNTAMRECM